MPDKNDKPVSVSPDLYDRFANYAHEAWSGWMTYVFEKSSVAYQGGKPDGVLIPQDLVERWKRQMATSYYDLPMEEQESDRDEADKIIACFDAPNEGETEAKV